MNKTMDEKIEETKNSDLSPAMVTKMTQPKKTWFIERTGDKFIFACEEEEAWKTLTNRSTWARHDFKIIGVSDGHTYAKIINESKSKAREIHERIVEVEKEVNKYRKTEEKFVFEDLLDTEDPKVIKIKGIIRGYDDKLDILNEEYSNMTKNVAKTAFNAELQVAIDSGNKQFPGNHDIITPGASKEERSKILNKMNGL